MEIYYSPLQVYHSQNHVRHNTVSVLFAPFNIFMKATHRDWGRWTLNDNGLFIVEAESQLKVAEHGVTMSKKWCPLSQVLLNVDSTSSQNIAASISWQKQAGAIQNPKNGCTVLWAKKTVLVRSPPCPRWLWRLPFPRMSTSWTSRGSTTCPTSGRLLPSWGWSTSFRGARILTFPRSALSHFMRVFLSKFVGVQNEWEFDCFQRRPKGITLYWLLFNCQTF